MAQNRPGLQVAPPIVLVAVLALALTVLLALAKLDRTLADVEESRLRFTLGELRTNLETGLDLGLHIRGLGNAQAALDAELRQDPDIMSIAVIDPGGAVVFSSGPSAPNLHIPPSRHNKRDWLLRDAGTLTLGATLSNNFGAPAGTLVLRYSGAKHAAALDSISRHLWLAALCAAVITALAFGFGVRQLSRRMDRTLGAMEQSLGQERAAADTDRHAAALVEQVNRSCAAALHDIEALRDTLEPGKDAP